MHWRNAKNNPPPQSGNYLVLSLYQDEDSQTWVPCFAFYHDDLETDNNAFWYTADNEEIDVKYWMSFTPLPPLPLRPNQTPCEYYGKTTDAFGYCSARKNYPYCECMGDIERCEKK